MFAISQLVAQPLAPFVAQVPAAGVVSWPIGLQVAAWLVLAALVGTALGILREHTSGRSLPRIEAKKQVRQRRHAQLRHA
jgi:hypothetical protein